jgi:transcriptional regulator with XRE-family HTH domain
VNYFETDFAKRMEKLSGPADCVRIYRENKGWTQEELGRKAGVAKNYVSDWENGHRKISRDKAKILGQLFDISAGYFI